MSKKRTLRKKQKDAFSSHGAALDVPKNVSAFEKECSRLGLNLSDMEELVASKELRNVGAKTSSS